eukprot:g6859.t1
MQRQCSNRSWLAFRHLVAFLTLVPEEAFGVGLSGLGAEGADNVLDRLEKAIPVLGAERKTRKELFEKLNKLDERTQDLKKLGWSDEARAVLFEREGAESIFSLPVAPDDLFIAKEPRHYLQAASPAVLRNNGLDLDLPAYAQYVILGSEEEKVEAEALLLHARGIKCVALLVPSHMMSGRSDGQAGSSATPKPIPMEGKVLEDAYCFQDRGSSQTGIQGLWQLFVAREMRQTDFSSFKFSENMPAGWDSPNMKYRLGDSMDKGLTEGRNSEGVLVTGNYGILVYHAWLFPDSIAGQFMWAARQLLPRLPPGFKPGDWYIKEWLTVAALARHLGVQPRFPEASAISRHSASVSLMNALVGTTTSASASALSVDVDLASWHTQVKKMQEALGTTWNEMTQAIKARLRPAAADHDGAQAKTKKKILVRLRTGDVIDGQGTPLGTIQDFPTPYTGGGSERDGAQHIYVESLLVHAARAEALRAHFARQPGGKEQVVGGVDIVTDVFAGGGEFLQGAKEQGCPKGRNYVEQVAKIWRRAFPKAEVASRLGEQVEDPSGKKKMQSSIEAVRAVGDAADQDVVGALQGYDVTVLSFGGFNGMIALFSVVLQLPGVVRHWTSAKDNPYAKSKDAIKAIYERYESNCAQLDAFQREAIRLRNLADPRCREEFTGGGNPVHCNQDLLDPGNEPLYLKAYELARDWEQKDQSPEGQHPLLTALTQAARKDQSPETGPPLLDEGSYDATLRNVLRGMNACMAWVARNTAAAELVDDDGGLTQEAQSHTAHSDGPGGVTTMPLFQDDVQVWKEFTKQEYAVLQRFLVD